MQQVISGTTGGNVYTYGGGGERGRVQLLALKTRMFRNKSIDHRLKFEAAFKFIFLALLVALHLIPVSKSVSRTFGLA